MLFTVSISSQKIKHEHLHDGKVKKRMIAAIILFLFILMFCYVFLFSQNSLLTVLSTITQWLNRFRLGLGYLNRL